MISARLRGASTILIALGAAIAVVATGALPLDELGVIGARVWQVLLFLGLIAIVAELLDEAGAFRVASRTIATWGRGRTALLFALYGGLCTVTTILLSIDTTAVLLTPVGIALARSLALDAIPFAFAALWLSNTASLLLPVSNLTNLLAVHGGDIGVGAFVGHTIRPQLAVLAATGLVLAALFGRGLRGRYTLPDNPPREDPWLLGASACAVLAVTGAIAAGLPAWLGALAGLVILIVAVQSRRPGTVRLAGVARMVPWRAIALALALFVVVGWLAALLTGPGGAWSGARLSPAQLVGAGALSANLVNNLPAYLLLEPLVGDPRGLVGLLVGVNAGALLTPWGSLATILWLHICRARLLDVTPMRVLRTGLVLVPVVLLAGALAV